MFNNTKFAIFGDNNLSQDLIVILRNITQLYQDGGPALEQHWVNASCLLGCGHSKLESLTQC